MSNNHTDVILEDMNSKFDLVVELVTEMRKDITGMATKDDIAELKADIKVIKAAVTDTSHQVQDHEQRITTLETAS